MATVVGEPPLPPWVSATEEIMEHLQEDITVLMRKAMQHIAATCAVICVQQKQALRDMVLLECGVQGAQGPGTPRCDENQDSQTPRHFKISTPRLDDLESPELAGSSERSRPNVCELCAGRAGDLIRQIAKCADELLSCEVGVGRAPHGREEAERSRAGSTKALNIQQALKAAHTELRHRQHPAPRAQADDVAADFARAEFPPRQSLAAGAAGAGDAQGAAGLQQLDADRFLCIASRDVRSSVAQGAAEAPGPARHSPIGSLIPQRNCVGLGKQPRSSLENGC